MKPYELTVLFHPDLEMDLEKSLEKIVALVKEYGGKIKQQDNWGKKKLAYAIKEQEFAVYVGFELDLPATAPLKISNALNINNEVLRYLLVKEDQRIKLARETAGSEVKEETEESDDK